MKQKYCTSHCVSWSPGTYYHKSWNHPLALKVPLEPCLVLAPGFSEKVVSGSTGSPCPVYDNIPCPSISQVHSMGLVYLPIYIWLIFIVNLLVNVLYIECLGMCWTVELPVPAFLSPECFRNFWGQTWDQPLLSPTIWWTIWYILRRLFGRGTADRIYPI